MSSVGQAIGGQGPMGGAPGTGPNAHGLTVPWNEPSRVALPKHLYVHVPLCRSKCAYCDFFSRTDDGSIPHADLIETTLEMLRGWLLPTMRRVPLETLYIGGGTPTVLGSDLVTLVRELTAIMPLADGAEVTVEANPESVTPELLAGLAEAGVTRLSIGVQSLDDATLQLLGRCHDAEAALDAVRSALEAGLDVGADLICGVPGLSHEVWLETLGAIIDAGVQHVSVYPLSIEPGTPMAEAIAAGRVAPPDEDATVAAMDAAAGVLVARGLTRYEVANYAVPGHESRHNTAYWTGWPYLGIGGGAHGMLAGDQAFALGLIPAEESEIARVRYGYTADSFPMRAEKPLTSFETMTAPEAFREDAMLGMRMTRGVADELVMLAGATGAMESLVADGLVVHEDGRWRPTERGWLFGNEIFSRIWGAVE